MGDARYPNTKGTAKRDTEKTVRVGTHEFVISECFKAFDVKHVIEHGMGIASTPLFHAQKPRTLLSFENEKQWQTCAKCGSDDVVHSIKAFTLETYEKDVTSVVIDPSKTLVLLDANNLERDPLFEFVTSLRVNVIVEHDAETFSEQTVSKRRKARDLGYHCFQFIAKSPETALYVLTIPDFVIASSDFCEF
jgi:hypothetical protein